MSKTDEILGKRFNKAGEARSANAVVDLYTKLLARVEKENSPDALLDHLKEDPDTAWKEITLLSNLKEKAQKDLFTEVLKTDHVIEHLNISDLGNVRGLIYESHIKTWGDIMAAKGAFTTMRNAGVGEGMLYDLFEKSSPERQMDIIAGSGALDALVLMLPYGKKVSGRKLLKHLVEELKEQDIEKACMMMVGKDSQWALNRLGYKNDELKAWCEELPGQDQRIRVVEADRVVKADERGTLERLGIDAEEWIANGAPDVELPERTLA